MSAAWSPRPLSIWRSTQLSAKFIRPPSNQRGHWTPRETSRTRVYGRLNRRPRSRTTASQYQSGSAMLRRCSSSSDPTPSERMNLARRVRSAYSRAGRQTISSLPVSVIRSSREGSVPGRELLGQRGGPFGSPDGQGRDEPEHQGRVRERDQRALAWRQRVVLGSGIPPALHDRPEADDQDEEENRRPAGQERQDPDGVADHPVRAREGGHDAAAVERRYRDQVEEIDQDRAVAERAQQRELELDPGPERRPGGKRAGDRPRHGHPGLHRSVARLALHRDEGADERDEHGRAGRNALEPHRDGVAHLVDEDQQDEAGGEEPAPLDRVGTDREEHGRQRLELQHARQQTQELGLAEDEEQAGAGDPRRRSAGVRGPGFVRGLRLLKSLVHRPEILDLAGAAPGLGRLGHAGGSLIGRGMNQALYTMMPRNTSFMIPKFAAMTW